jgi:hypothetical protein
LLYRTRQPRAKVSVVSGISPFSITATAFSKQKILTMAGEAEFIHRRPEALVA